MITITRQPGDIAFARSRNIFELRSSDYTVPGSQASISFDLFASAFAPGEKFTLTLDGIDMVFMLDGRTPVSDPAVGPAYRFYDADSLLRLLQSVIYLHGCYVSFNHFTNYDRFRISFAANGRHDLSVSSSDGLAIFVPDSYLPGADDAVLPNYRVAVRFQVESLNHRGYTPWVCFSPVDSLTSVDTSLLLSYLSDPSLPESVDEFQPYPLYSFTLRYRLEYAEVYGQTPLYQDRQSTSWHQLLPGELEQSRALQLLPDWCDHHPDRTLDSRVIVLGSDDHRTVSIRRNELDYLYLFSYSQFRTVKVLAHLYADSPDPVVYTHQFDLESDTVHALPVNPTLLGAMPMHTAMLLEIYDSDDQLLFSRIYVISESVTDTAQLYLADKYGLLRSFIPRTLSRSLTFEAEQLRHTYARSQAVTRRSETFSASSFPLPARDADLLADSLPNKAFILIGTQLHPLRILPSNFTTFTSDQNLTTLTFDFFIESAQQHAMPYFLPASIHSPFPSGALLTEAGQPLATEQFEFLTVR